MTLGGTYSWIFPCDGAAPPEYWPQMDASCKARFVSTPNRTTRELAGPQKRKLKPRQERDPTRALSKPPHALSRLFLSRTPAAIKPHGLVLIAAAKNLHENKHLPDVIGHSQWHTKNVVLLPLPLCRQSVGSDRYFSSLGASVGRPQPLRRS